LKSPRIGAKSHVSLGALPPCYLAGYAETLLVSLTRPDGCIIFVDPDDAGVVVSGDRVVARLSFGNTVTFKVYVEDGGRQLLKPLNSHYPMIDTPFRIIGKVLGQFSE